MRGDSAQSGKAVPEAAPAQPIVLSRWINEPYPPLTELLSAHDVARLTRRPRWLLVGLVLIGRFPRKARFRGRAVGWWLSDVLEWMARDLALDRHRLALSWPRARRQPRQDCLPLGSRGRCAAVRVKSLIPKHSREE
jgi:predicted DNA-binding transcriptional regulator AlpA